MTVSEKLEEVRTLLSSLDANNRDHLAAISNLKTQEAELMQQLEQEQAKQERIETAIVETAQVVDALEIIPGMQLRDMCIDEQSYQYVKIAFQQLLNSKDATYIEELTTIQTANKEELRAAAEREANLLFQLKQRDVQLAEKDAQINTLEFERDEALKVRDNAAAEIEGYKLAVAEKQEQIDKLRAEIAVGAKEAAKLDQTEQLKKAQEEWVNSRIKVTNIRWTDEIRKTHYNAELVTTGEPITFGRLEKGKYLEVTAEEAERFRAEANAALEVAATVQDDSPALVEEVVVPVVAEVQQFPQTEEAGSIVVEGYQLANQQPSVQLGGQTLEEAFRRIQELEAGQAELKGRVDTLQARVG